MKQQVAISLTLGILVVGGVSLSSASQGYREWLLPEKVNVPANNRLTPQRIHLGKQLFFDKRLSGTGQMSCATCHAPEKGWSDGLPTAKGKNNKVLDRASPPITNTAYNQILMWDGRKSSLEDQASGPMESKDEMDMDMKALSADLASIAGYRQAFAAAYPGEGISKSTITRALAAFERTVVCTNSPFDRWVAGDSNAMTREQKAGFEVFRREDKGNCAACHSAPNFTDDGFHNIGLKSFGRANPDLGRYKQRPVRLMKGAFKTPSLRNVAKTAPYFHDGSAQTLMEVVKHYVRGGDVKTNLSPEMKKLDLSDREQHNLVQFLNALSCNNPVVAMPKLPN
jgi:cytochrome c peroxidase